MIDTLKALIEIPSVSGTDEVKKALRQSLQICQEFGFRTKNCDDILGWAEIGSGDELMGILCHLDVVPAGEGWTHPPFSVTLEDGRLYGRGVMDDKGPAVAAMYAIKDILASGKKLNKRVRLIFGCQEETGDWDDMEYYKAHEEIPSFGFTPDADFPAIYGEKGILLLELSMDAGKSGFREIQGGEAANMVADWAKAVLDDGRALQTKGMAAHGSTPEEGENAITKLMEQAQDASGFAKFYMDKIGWSLNGENFDCALFDEASGNLTLNVGQVAMEQGRVCLKIDVRYPVTFSAEAVLQKLREKCAEYDVSVDVMTELKPVYMEKDGTVIRRLMEAYREATHDMTEPQVMGGGTYARAMDNIVAFGPVFPGRECTEHKKDEWIYLEDLEKARDIYRLAIEKLACNEE